MNSGALWIQNFDNSYPVNLIFERNTLTSIVDECSRKYHGSFVFRRKHNKTMVKSMPE